MNRPACQNSSARTIYSKPEGPGVAEEVGFEPTVDFHLRRFSRPVHSTTLPLLRPHRHMAVQPILKAPVLEHKSHECGGATPIDDSQSFSPARVDCSVRDK